MNWKNLTIGKKVAFGFGVVVTMMAVVGFLSYTGVGGIVTNAAQVIDGNELDGILAQKEVDHLNWANKVNALLTDESVTELNVQTDDHLCQGNSEKETGGNLYLRGEMLPDHVRRHRETWRPSRHVAHRALPDKEEDEGGAG